MTRREEFCASHNLVNKNKNKEWNDEIFGNCANVHGHNYILEVTVSGAPEPDTGFVISSKDLKALIERKILSKCDHSYLNKDVDFLENIMPSTENLATAFWDQLVDELPENCRLYNVRLMETPKIFVDYRGE